MSRDLRDFRGKLTVRGDCALDAKARATGKDKSEIVREIIDAWAESQIQEARLLHKKLEAEGEPGIVERRVGRTRE